MEEGPHQSRILWFINSAELTPLKAEALYPWRSCSSGGSCEGFLGGPEAVPPPDPS